MEQDFLENKRIQEFLENKRICMLMEDLYVLLERVLTIQMGDHISHLLPGEDKSSSLFIIYVHLQLSNMSRELTAKQR